jgi:hypothetical protein
MSTFDKGFSSILLQIFLFVPMFPPSIRIVGSACIANSYVVLILSAFMKSKCFDLNIMHVTEILQDCYPTSTSNQTNHRKQSHHNKSGHGHRLIDATDNLAIKNRWSQTRHKNPNPWGLEMKEP